MGKKAKRIDDALRTAWANALMLHDRVVAIAESVRNGATREQLQAESKLLDDAFEAATQQTDKQTMEYFAAAHLELCRVNGKVELATFNDVASSSLYSSVFMWAARQYVLFRFKFHVPHAVKGLTPNHGQDWVNAKLMEWTKEIEPRNPERRMFEESEFRMRAYMELVQALLIVDRVPRSQSAVSPLPPIEVPNGKPPKCPKCGGSMTVYSTKGNKQYRRCKCGETKKTIIKSTK